MISYNERFGPIPRSVFEIGRKQPLIRAVTMGTKKGKKRVRNVVLSKGKNMSIKWVNQTIGGKMETEVAGVISLSLSIKHDNMNVQGIELMKKYVRIIYLKAGKM